MLLGSLLSAGGCNKGQEAPQAPGGSEPASPSSATTPATGETGQPSVPVDKQSPDPEKAVEAPPCTPQCKDRECGSDGCGDQCGTCTAEERCTQEGKCRIPCKPACEGRKCGDDGCGGQCGACHPDLKCNEAGQCIEPPCVPECLMKECGPDGCGGVCGVCPPGVLCHKGKCDSAPCVPDCTGRACGDDGCEGSCGLCPFPDKCEGGQCIRRIASGLFVGPGKEPWAREEPTIGDVVRRLGRSPTLFHTHVGFPSDWSGKCEFGAFPKDWANQVLAVNPTGGMMLTLLPQCGFSQFVADFGPGSPAWVAIQAFVKEAGAFPGPVFLRFAPDMNTHWYPWATCYFDNDKAGCAGKPVVYREAFQNFYHAVRELQVPNVRVVWTPHEFEPYWSVKVPDYPAYSEFYPGDDSVDWVGLSLYYQDTQAPKPDELTNRLKWFYDEFASPQGHNKPMLLAETASECPVRENLSCPVTLGNFDAVAGTWWGAWGELKPRKEETAPTSACRWLRTGSSHVVFEAPPGADPNTAPHACSGYYVGGTAFTVEWDKGLDVTRGNVFVMHARKEESGDVPTLQVEFCDTRADECPKEDPCCDKGTVSATFRVEKSEWERFVMPLSEFRPTVPGTKPILDWSHIRAVKLHLLSDGKSDNLAPLHLDGFAVGSWNRPGESRCKTAARKWAELVFSPRNCVELPNLRAVFWHHDRREQGEEVRDYRIPDYPFFGNLLSAPCYDVPQLQSFAPGR